MTEERTRGRGGELLLLLLCNGYCNDDVSSTTSTGCTRVTRDARNYGMPERLWRYSGNTERAIPELGAWCERIKGLMTLKPQEGEGALRRPLAGKLRNSSLETPVEGEHVHFGPAN